jgi:HAD superfamily hydrolase (TIGR01509 family)
MRRAVLWDMDGTLVDSEPLHDAALVGVLADLGIEAPDEFHSLVIGRAAEEIHAYCVEKLGVTLGLEEWLTRKYRRYFTSLDRLEPREGAVELFKELRTAGVPEAVASNSDRLVVARNLKAAGLAFPRAISVSRNDVREGKPKPEIYLRAAWLVRREPAECIDVEDSTTGAGAGLAAGMTTLFWPQASHLATPAGATRIESFAHLAETLRDG